MKGNIYTSYINTYRGSFRKIPKGGKSMSEDILGGRVYSEQYSISKG